jgi:predicted DNA-binding transcriptional regulator YafY
MLVPLLADGERHRLSDLARELGTDVATLRNDLAAIVDRAADPEGYGENVQLYLEGDQAALVSSHFLRPMRLTSAEVQALELGLAILRLERPIEEHRAIDGARARLAAARARPVVKAAGGTEVAPPYHYGGPPLPPEQGRHLERVRDAMSRDRMVTLRYRKPGSSEAAERVVSPFLVLRASGRYFIVAHAGNAGEVRTFRLDRVEGVELRKEPRVAVDPFWLDRLRELDRVFLGGERGEVKIRYSARVARWIEEREAVERLEDGSVVARYPLGDEEWVVRHVLQYGAEAEVLEPKEVRRALVRRLAAMA